MTRALLVTLLAASPAVAQQRPALTPEKVRTETLSYKKTPQGELFLHAYYPTGWSKTDTRPVAIFFFGGGWKNGTAAQFEPQSACLASRGIVALAADYRIASKHQATPDVCVEDAKSAVRWVRANAGTLGIDPKKVIAGGGSAGGHLAACAALVSGFDAAGDPGGVSCVPDALVLFNPVLNLTLGKARTVPGKDGTDIAKAISPTLYLTKSAPPAVIFFGTADAMLAQGREYAAKAKELGVRAELYTAAGQPHGFFNRGPWCHATARRMDVFLASLGHLTGGPTVTVPGDAALVRE